VDAVFLEIKYCISIKKMQNFLEGIIDLEASIAP